MLAQSKISNRFMINDEIVRKINSFQFSQRFKALDYFYFVVAKIQNGKIDKIIKSLYL